jgi:hypothetical protein
VTPASSPTAADHAPAQQITVSVAMSPAPVETPVMRSPSRWIAVTAVWVWIVAPKDRAPAA